MILALAATGLALAAGLVGFGLGRLTVRRELVRELDRYARLRDPPMGDELQEQDNSPDEWPENVVEEADEHGRVRIDGRWRLGSLF